jgi:hypothetical protein
MLLILLSLVLGVESFAMRREGPSDVIDSVVFSFGGGGWTRTL